MNVKYLSSDLTNNKIFDTYYTKIFNDRYFLIIFTVLRQFFDNQPIIKVITSCSYFNNRSRKKDFGDEH